MKNKKDISNLFEKGKKIFLKELMVIYIPSEKTEFLFTSKKGIDSAVKRNTIKRKLREISRKLDLTSNYHIALIGNENLLEVKNYSQIISQLNKEFNKFSRKI